MSVLYVDSSALVKLVVEEPETEALQRELAGWPLRASSVVAAVEVPRAARRGSDRTDVRARADELVKSLTLLELNRDLVAAAAELAPTTLRTLDAIHLASALSLRTDLGALVTYDQRLEDAATAAGATVLAPR